MAYDALTHTGNAPDATLANPMGATDLTFTLAPAGVGSGYPAGPAYVEVDPGSSSNEKILYASRSGDTFTISTIADRGVDGTTAQTHVAAAVVRHVFTAVEAQQANDVAHQVLGQIAAKGDILVGSAANTLTKVAAGSAGQYPAWQPDGSIVPTTPPVTSVAGRTGAIVLATSDIAGPLDGRTIAGYTEDATVNANSGAAVTYDATVKNVYDTTLTANLTVTLAAGVSGTAWSLSVIHRQDATGGRVVTWPASVKWPNGVAPSPDTSVNAVNVYTLFTVDGGTTWLGFLAGRGMK